MGQGSVCTWRVPLTSLPFPPSLTHSGDSMAGLYFHLWASHTRRAG